MTNLWTQPVARPRSLRAPGCRGAAASPQFVGGASRASRLAVVESQQSGVRVKDLQGHRGAEYRAAALGVPQAGGGLAPGPVHARQDQQPHVGAQVGRVHPFPAVISDDPPDSSSAGRCSLSSAWRTARTSRPRRWRRRRTSRASWGPGKGPRRA